MKTTTIWKHDHAFESRLEKNVFHIDGNRKEGPNPKALLLSAIAACSGIDVVDILQKNEGIFFRPYDRCGNGANHGASACV